MLKDKPWESTWGNTIEYHVNGKSTHHGKWWCPTFFKLAMGNPSKSPIVSQESTLLWCKCPPLRKHRTQHGSAIQVLPMAQALSCATSTNQRTKLFGLWLSICCAAWCHFALATAMLSCLAKRTSFCNGQTLHQRSRPVEKKTTNRKSEAFLSLPNRP